MYYTRYKNSKMKTVNTANYDTNHVYITTSTGVQCTNRAQEPEISAVSSLHFSCSQGCKL